MALWRPRTTGVTRHNRTAFFLTIFTLLGVPTGCRRASTTTSVASVTNTGLAVKTARVSDGTVAFTVSECGQGRDLNGDGGLDDDVLHVFRAGAPVNLGLHTSSVPRSTDDLLAFPVSEQRQGQGDLNGDLDHDDSVLHVYEEASGTTTNLGLAVFIQAPVIPRRTGGFAERSTGRDLVVFAVPESDQGGTDFNGDGDSQDRVVHVYRPSIGSVANLGAAVSGEPLASGSFVAYERVEAGGQDLNGDGDTQDTVPHVYDTVTNAEHNLGLASFRVQFENELLVFPVLEGSQGVLDLNGDGDTLDAVLHVHDAVSGLTRNLQVASSLGGVLIGEGVVALSVDEGPQGTDLNADMDQGDSVLFVYDSASGSLVNVGIPVSNSGIKGGWVTASVSEQEHGGLDLNADGDSFDHVLHAYDASRDRLVNTGLAGGPMVRTDDAFAVAVEELSQGNADLDGDGQVAGDVLFLLPLGGGPATNTGIRMAGGFSYSDSSHVVYGRVEEDEDLNGDGDFDDVVLETLETRTFVQSTLGFWGMAYDSLGLPFGTGRNRFAVRVCEALHGNSDLNGDGDTDDCVLFVVDLPPR